jgi:hypothetical protein
MADEFARAERGHQRAAVASHLHAAMEQLDRARLISATFGLDIDIPQHITRSISTAIEAVAHAHQQENPHEQTG